jgi:hypothetical protein
LFISAELSQLPIGDGRKAERRIVNLAAALRENGARTTQIVILDISAGGFRAQAADDVQEGCEVWLKLPHFEAKRSRVIWRKGSEVGCEFETPAHENEIALIVAPAPRRIPKGIFRRG